MEVKARARGRWQPGTWALGILTFFSGESQPQGTWPATITTCYLCRPPLQLPLGDLPWTWRKAGLVPWPMGCASATPDLLENVDIFPHYNSQSAKTASIKVWSPGLPTHARPGLPGQFPCPLCLPSPAPLSRGNCTTQPGRLTWLCSCSTYWPCSSAVCLRAAVAHASPRWCRQPRRTVPLTAPPHPPHPTCCRLPHSGWCCCHCWLQQRAAQLGVGVAAPTALPAGEGDAGHCWG